MKQKIYIETSVISYLCGRLSRNLVVAANQRLTHDWWKTCLQKYDAYVSELVLDEICVGDPAAADKRKKAIKGMIVLPINADVEHIAGEILKRAALPQKVMVDILHISIASVFKMDYLLTWNCAHIANPRWQARIRLIVGKLGCIMPEICTPQQLYEGEGP